MLYLGPEPIKMRGKGYDLAQCLLIQQVLNGQKITVEPPVMVYAQQFILGPGKCYKFRCFP